MNRETKLDIICMTQGYLGVGLIVGLAFFGTYMGWWNLIWNANIKNNARIMMKIVILVIKNNSKKMVLLTVGSLENSL